MDNIRTILVDLPVDVKGYTICVDDFYTIIINSKLSNTQRQKSYQHEMDHIQQNDFESKNSAGLIEVYSHKKGGFHYGRKQNVL